MNCFDCLFDPRDWKNCTERKKCWMDEEYTSYTISKRDMMFLQ